MPMRKAALNYCPSQQDSTAKQTRFVEDRMRQAAQRLAATKQATSTPRRYEDVFDDYAFIIHFAEMVSDFEQLAIRKGLPDGAYETFEYANRVIAEALIELEEELNTLNLICA